MPGFQVARHEQIRDLSAQLASVNGAKATAIIERMDRLVEEAAAVERVETPQQAAAALEIALRTMGADPEHSLPHERLIIQAIGFLQTLAVLAVTQQVCAPCMGGTGLVISRMTGIA